MTSIPHIGAYEITANTEFIEDFQMSQDENGQSGTNKARTESKIDRNLTRLGSRYELVISHVIGPFESARAAADHARRFYSSLEQDEDRLGNSWDIQIAGADRPKV